MGQSHNPDPTGSLQQIRELATAEPDVRERLMGDFLDHRRNTFRILARHACRKFVVDINLHLDDVAQVILVTAWHKLREHVADPSLLDTIRNWEAFVYHSSFNELRAFQDVQGAAGVVKVQSRQRRFRALHKERQGLVATLGREPTDEEVVESFNEKMLASRKDPARQGALATVHDLRPLSVSLDAFGSVDPTASRGGSDDSPLSMLDWPRLEKLVAARFVGEDDMEAAGFAAWYLEQFREDEVRATDAAWIARERGWSRAKVKTLIARITEVIRDVLSSDLGINGPDGDPVT